LSQRFWAGATEQNRYNAPFQVLNDGSMRALKGKVGNFNINETSLSIGSEDTWAAFMQSVFLYGDYFLLRDNGAVSGQRRELSWNLYKDQQGFPLASAVSIFNTMDKSSESGYTNIGLEIEASGASHNYALYVSKGAIRAKAIIHDFQEITGTNQTIDAEYSRVLINSGVIAGDLSLPFYAKKGYEVTIKNISENDFFLKSNNGSIIQADGSATTTNTFKRWAVKTFFFNGQYWFETFNNSQ